jgi:hypothetical protein
MSPLILTNHYRQNWHQYFILLIIFFAGFFGHLMQSVDWFRAIPGDLVDTRFNSVILEHLFQWVQGHTPSLWSPTFFYPFEKVLAFSDNFFGSGWIYILFRFAGLQREYALLGWFFVGQLLNFWVTYYVLRRLGFSIIAAGAGAFVFCFSLAALPKETHIQLTYRFAIPLSFLATINFVQTKQLSALSQSIFWLAVQFYCAIYLGIFLVYLLFATYLALLLSQFRLFNSGWRLGWWGQSVQQKLTALMLFLLSTLSIGWLLYHYRAVSMHYGISRSLGEIWDMIPSPSSYLLADQSLLTGWLSKFAANIPMRHEQQMFFGLGISLLALCGIAIAWRSRLITSNRVASSVINPARIASITLLLLIVMTISVSGFSLYKWFLYLPGVSSIRAVSRVVLVMLLPLGMLVAACFDYVISRVKGSFFKWLLIGGMVVLLAAESIFYEPYKTPISVWAGRQTLLKSLMPKTFSSETILYVTNTLPERIYDLAEVDAMQFAQDLRLPTLNGYSGNVPPGYSKPDPCVDFKDRIKSYIDFKPDSKFSAEDLARRVIVLSPEKCPNQPAIKTNRVIDQSLASQIKLGLEPKISGKTLDVRVLISNYSPDKFSTLSTKGPVRLSWRFVALDPSERPRSDPEWAARKDLFFTLEPGATQVETILTELPVRSGTYIFEVSLVQDGVAWFHNLGMPIAQWRFEIK